MTCEYNEGSCDECEIPYCPDQIEDIQQEYRNRVSICNYLRREFTEAKLCKQRWFDEFEEFLDDS